MSLGELTSRDAVLKAIKEYDDLGRDAFLSRYGFGKSRSYVLIHQDKHYDSKAIAGVALKYQPGVGRALRSDEFSGGANTVQAKLEELGFVVRAFGEPQLIPRAPAIQNVRNVTQDNGLVLLAPDEEFSPGSGRQRTWDMLRSSATLEEFAEKFAAQTSVAPSITVANFLSWLRRSGRAAIPQGGATGLLEANEADDEPFDPTSVTDAREKVLREIRARRGQKQFRDALIEAYAARCAITGCEVLDVLEAAHVTPYLGPETNHVTNGLLLRADLHTLFDTQLVAVDPETLKVLVSPRIQDPMYRALHGQTLRTTKTRASAPSEAALRKHREGCGF